MSYPLTTRLNVMHDWMPYAFLDDVFTPEELNKVIQYCDKLQLGDARVGGTAQDANGEFSSSRKSKVSFFQINDTNAWIFNRLQGAATYLNNECFRYDLVGFDTVQYTEYRDSNDLYDFHVDCWMGQNVPADHVFPRKLSCSLVLSGPEEYSGGQFEVMHSSQPTEIQQRKGRLIAFPSYMLHRVKPVFKGTRKSLVVWIKGPMFR